MGISKPAIVALPDKMLNFIRLSNDALRLSTEHLSMIRDRAIPDLIVRKQFDQLPFYNKLKDQRLHTRALFEGALKAVMDYLLRQSGATAELIQFCERQFTSFSFDTLYSMTGVPWELSQFNSKMYTAQSMQPVVGRMARLLGIFFDQIIRAQEISMSQGERFREEFMSQRNEAITAWEAQQKNVGKQVQVALEGSQEKVFFFSIMKEAGYTQVDLKDDTGEWTALNPNGKTPERGNIAEVLNPSADPANRLFMDAKKRIRERARGQFGGEEED